MNKRTVKFNGLQLGFKPTENLIKIIDKEIKSIKVKTNELFDSDKVKKNSLLITRKQLVEYISQWRNVQLGDKVEYEWNNTNNTRLLGYGLFSMAAR